MRSTLSSITLHFLHLELETAPQLLPDRGIYLRRGKARCVDERQIYPL